MCVLVSYGSPKGTAIFTIRLMPEDRTSCPLFPGADCPCRTMKPFTHTPQFMSNCIVTLIDTVENLSEVSKPVQNYSSRTVRDLAKSTDLICCLKLQCNTAEVA